MVSYERFTDRARKVLQLANQEAQRFNHEYIGTEHVLLGLVKEGSGVAANVLKNLGLDVRVVRLKTEELLKPGPTLQDRQHLALGKLPLRPRAVKALEFAVEESRLLGHSYQGTEHLLLGLLREQPDGAWTAAQTVLEGLGMTPERVRAEINRILGTGLGNDDAGPEVVWETIRTEVKMAGPPQLMGVDPAAGKDWSRNFTVFTNESRAALKAEIVAEVTAQLRAEAFEASKKLNAAWNAQLSPLRVPDSVILAEGPTDAAAVREVMERDLGQPVMVVPQMERLNIVQAAERLNRLDGEQEAMRRRLAMLDHLGAERNALAQAVLQVRNILTADLPPSAALSRIERILEVLP